MNTVHYIDKVIEIYIYIGIILLETVIFDVIF